MSLLTLVQDVQRRLTLNVTTSVISKVTDVDVMQMLGLAKQTGDALVNEHKWTGLMVEKTFLTTATEEQTASGVVPADLAYFINETFFNRTNTRRVIGPLTPMEWAAEKAILATVLRDSFRIRGGKMLVTPVPAAGQTWAFEYISDLWIYLNGGSTLDGSAFADDSDTFVFNHELMVLGVLWRWKEAKGLDYAEAQRNYEVYEENLMAKDGSARSIAFSDAYPIGARIPYVSEGAWNLS
jgi:hypothetical protein